jgi:hypothetical protein
MHLVVSGAVAFSVAGTRDERALSVAIERERICKQNEKARQRRAVSHILSSRFGCGDRI